MINFRCQSSKKDLMNKKKKRKLNLRKLPLKANSLRKNRMTLSLTLNSQILTMDQRKLKKVLSNAQPKRQKLSKSSRCKTISSLKLNPS